MGCLLFTDLFSFVKCQEFYHVIKGKTVPTLQKDYVRNLIEIVLVNYCVSCMYCRVAYCILWLSRGILCSIDKQIVISITKYIHKQISYTYIL